MKCFTRGKGALNFYLVKRNYIHVQLHLPKCGIAKDICPPKR